MSFDLDAYVGRVGWEGERRPGPESLTSLLDAHMRSVPFENLDVLLGRPIHLDIDSIQRKLVGAGRGGYCYEHAVLFAAALDALGFEPTLHSARVTLLHPRAEAPRTHVLLSVPLPEGTFVLDPGFGLLAPRAPVPLIDASGPGSADATHWMADLGDVWVLRTVSDDKIVDCWESPFDEAYPVDLDLGNYFTSTNPDSVFVNRIMMRAISADGQVSVMNRDVTFRTGTDVRKEELVDRAALRSLLQTHFGFDLPDLANLRVPSIAGWD